MDGKAVAQETTPNGSNSPGSSSFLSSSVSYPDSSNDFSVKYGGLSADEYGAAADGGGGGGDSGSSDGGFMSGEEEFETASEMPPSVVDPEVLTPEKGVGEDNSLSPMLKSVSDDNEIVGNEKVRVLKEGELVGEVGESVKQMGGEADDEVSLGKLENGGVDSEEKGILLETGLDEKTISSETKHEKVEDSENEVKGVEGVEGSENGVTDVEQSDFVVGSEEKKSEVSVADRSILGSETEQKEGVFNGKADDIVDDDDKSIEGEGVKLTNEGDSIVDSSVLESVHVDVAKPGFVVVGDVEGSEETEVKEKEVSSDESSVKLDNEFDQISCNDDKLVEEVAVKLTGDEDSIVDSSIAESVHVDVARPGIVIVGDAEGIKEDEVKEKEGLVDEVDQTSRNADEPDDLTAAYDDVKLVARNNVKENDFDASVSVAEPEGKRDGEETKVNVDERSNVSLFEKEEKPVSLVEEEEKPMAEAEPELKTKANADEGDVIISGEKVDEVGGDEIQSEAVSNRGFSVEPGEDDVEGSGTDEETEEMIFSNSEAAKQFLEELEKASSGIGSHSGNSNDQSQRIDGQIVTDSDEEVDTDDEGEGKGIFDSAALAALLKAASGSTSDGDNITITSQDGSRLFSVERPAGLGSSLRSIKPAAPRSNRSNIFSQPNLMTASETENNLSEEDRKKLEKLQNLRVKFLRLVHKLGHSAEDSIAAQVLYRLALLAGRQTGQMFSLDFAKRKAMELEDEGKDDLDFSLNILVLGKAGVGKSATINSILGDQKALIDAFEPTTTSAREIIGIVDGVKIKVIDTPGLKSSAMEQSANRKLLSSVKKLTNKCPPDIVLYVDRLDAQTRDLNDLPLLRTITSTLGSSIWKNAILTLTHAASAPPDGPSGSPLSYDVFVAQRSHIVQQSIGQAVGDLRLMNPSLMNPVSLVENHPSCRKNREGQKVLPNGQTWRPQLLLLSYSLKILSEANSLLKPQDPLDNRRLFGFRVRSPPLPYLLSWLLQSRAHPKLSADQGGDNADSDIEIDDVSDSDQEDGEEDEYDSLPPFKPLRKAQLAKLTKEQKKAYFEEYDYRVKLLQKKQWREELKRMRQMKKGKAASESEYSYPGEEEDPENGAPAAVPVPLPDMVLPPSFDSDNPAYRYRFLEPTSQLLTRPVLDTHGWDHDCGYDGVNVEHSLALASRFPAVVSVQVTKDKKEFNIHLDSSVSAKHGENGSTMTGFDIQNVGKQLAYVVRGETKFKNLKKNKTTLGGSITFLGENVAPGVKLEDQIALGKRLVLVGSTGTVRSQGDSAYGANLEIRLREADFPIGQDQSSLGLSLVKWRGDLALGANLQSQISVGRHSKIAVRAGLNNKMSGQITVRTSSSDQLQIALMGILPIAMTIFKSIRPGASEKYSMY